MLACEIRSIARVQIPMLNWSSIMATVSKNELSAAQMFFFINNTFSS